MNACIVIGSFMIGFLVPDLFACFSQGKCSFPMLVNIISAVGFGLLSYGLLNR